jgi:hypothetical protein
VSAGTTGNAGAGGTTAGGAGGDTGGGGGTTAGGAGGDTGGAGGTTAGGAGGDTGGAGGTTTGGAGGDTGGAGGTTAGGAGGDTGGAGGTTAGGAGGATGGAGGSTTSNTNFSGLTETGIVSSMTVASDPVGDGLAMWSQLSSAGPVIFAAAYASATGWGAETVVAPGAASTTIPANAPADVHFLLDAQGNGIAVWSAAIDATHYNLFTATYTKGTEFSAAASLNPIFSAAGDMTTHAAPISLARGGDGSLYVAYYDVAADIHAFVLRRGPDNTWDAPLDLGMVSDAATFPLGPPQLAADQQGDSLVGYTALTAIHARRYLAGTGWQADQTLVTAQELARVPPQVAMNATGQGVLGWIDNNGTTITANAVRLDATAGFAAPEPVYTGLLGGSLAVAINGPGQICFAMGGVGLFVSCRLPADSAWPIPSQLLPADASPTSDLASAAVSLDDAGDAAAAWADPITTATQGIYVARRTAGIWQSPIQVTSGDLLFDPVVALDPLHGELLSSWSYEGVDHLTGGAAATALAPSP